MSSNIANIKVSLQYAAPYFVLLIMFSLDNVYLPWDVISNIRPGFLLMALYYWAIYRPALLPPILVFIIALALDVSNGTALGLHCLVLLPIFLFLKKQRRFLFEQPFFVVWLGFAATAVVVNCAYWFLVRISSYGFDLSFDTGVFMALLYDVAAGTFLFPLIAFVLFLIHRMLPHRTLRGGEIK